jgi:hypothetical protein
VLPLPHSVFIFLGGKLTITGDANGESVQYSKNVYDGVINDYPNPHLVLDHSTIQTSERKLNLET